MVNRWDAFTRYRKRANSLFVTKKTLSRRALSIRARSSKFSLGSRQVSQITRGEKRHIKERVTAPLINSERLDTEGKELAAERPFDSSLSPQRNRCHFYSLPLPIGKWEFLKQMTRKKRRGKKRKIQEKRLHAKETEGKRSRVTLGARSPGEIECPRLEAAETSCTAHGSEFAELCLSKKWVNSYRYRFSTRVRSNEIVGENLDKCENIVQ